MEVYVFDKDELLVINEKELLPGPINAFYVGSDKFNDFKYI